MCNKGKGYFTRCYNETKHTERREGLYNSHVVPRCHAAVGCGGLVSDPTHTEVLVLPPRAPEFYCPTFLGEETPSEVLITSNVYL